MKLAILILTLLPFAGFTQTTKEIYLKAEEHFNKAEYEPCIKLANNVKQKLGKTNPKIETLLACAYYNVENYTQASLSIKRIKMMVQSTTYLSDKYSLIHDLEVSINNKIDDLQTKFLIEKENIKINKQKSHENELLELTNSYKRKKENYLKLIADNEVKEKDRLKQLILEKDNNAWKNAITIKTKTSFENYLNNENNKLFLKEAKKYIRYCEVTKIILSEKNYDLFLKESKYFISLLWIEASNLSISTFPIEVTEIETLKILDLSYNYITVIPDDINKLINLTSLKLGDNEIKTIPFKIGELTGLVRLEVFYNKITRLPSSISKLKKLLVLDISDNNLTKFPNSILQCRELIAIDISANKQITSIPQEIINLKKLNHIKVDAKFESNSEALKQLEEKNKGVKIDFKKK